MAKSAENPTPAPTTAAQDLVDITSPEIHAQVRAILDHIRPAVQDDGGDLELVRITEEGVAQIRLHGACVGCPSSNMTLHMGVERYVREKVPQITGVEQID
ncbi:MAG: NifU family protein [Planctomycetota bacterium]